MRTLRYLLIGITCLSANLSAQTWRVDSAKLRGVAQDSTGQVWAIGYAPSRGLYRWGSDKWTPVLDHLPENSEPQAIASGADGAVYCVWSAGEDAHSVTWHRGADSKLLAQFSGSLGGFPSLFADAHGFVWINEMGPHIYRVTPQGKAECVYTIPDEDYIASGPTRGPRRMFNPVYVTADTLGRLWFWSGGAPLRSNLLSLQGLLIYDGESFKNYPHPVGVSYEKVSALAPEDPTHMLMSIADNRLYRVDIKTLTAEAVPEPDPGAFRYVQRMFHLDGDTYVVSNPPGGPVPEHSGEGRFEVLWRLSKGEWKRVVNGLDMRPQIAPDPLRPFLISSAGVWVGAFGTGPWLIPRDSAAPVHVDWQYNFSLDGSEALLQLPDKRMLIVDTNRGSSAVDSVELLGSYQAPAGIRTLNPLRPLIPDERGHLWGIIASGDKALSEWDGKSWSRHPLPFDIASSPRYSFMTDSQDQVWMLSERGNCQGPVAVLNPSRGDFDVYPDLPGALHAQLPNHPTFRVEQYPYSVPTFSADGRIAYDDRCGKVHYYDGQGWQSWTQQEINGDSRTFFPVTGPAIFNRAGNLTLGIQGTTWEYLPKAGWHSAAPEPGHEPARDLRGSQPSLTPPPGCEFGSPESIARDRMGTYWMTYRDRLYRALPGLCLAQTHSADHQPFIDGRTVKAAMIDPQGNAFLETYLHTNPEVGEYVIIDARPPLPQTSLRANVDATGAVKLRFGAAAKGRTWFTWRVDDGAWTRPSQDAEATVAGLAEGKHHIEAAAIDERLQIDPIPAAAQVEIRVDNQQQLAALIEKLQDPDFSVRNAAIAGLVRQPAHALPLLLSARETAGPDERWWIDAAIQRVQEALASHKGP